MQHGIHFISGLPRAGSTLLAGILRQNPGVHAAMSSPVGALFTALLRQMSQENEFALFITEAQREAILAGLFENYYRDIQAEKLVFDTNRLWCSKLPALAALFPDAKVIACVRDIHWVLDSLERLVRRNKFEPSKIFNFEPGGTVYNRVDGLLGMNGMVGFAYNALKEAYYGEQADRFMLLTYETLTRTPAKAMAAVYDFIGQPPFAHDFDHVDYAEEELDARLGTPGLHRVAAKVQHVERQTILPPDLVRRVENDAFWTDAKRNLRGVRVV
ncbi:sulfotransferase family protein [Ancylobacter sp. VNQ12]|uniref:sulfotransferase family protein n=1 Tax=Ancylobacter sp. VNQ12 TaxID=3400920 RepID=UPI003C0DE4A0